MIVKRQVVPPVLGNAQPGSTAPNTLSEASIASGLATSASTSSTDCATPSSAPANKGGSAPLVSILIPVVLFVFLLVLGGTLVSSPYSTVPMATRADAPDMSAPEARCLSQMAAPRTHEDHTQPHGRAAPLGFERRGTGPRHLSH